MAYADDLKTLGLAQTTGQNIKALTARMVVVEANTGSSYAATPLAAGTSPTASLSGGVLTFGIPAGLSGVGAPPTVTAAATIPATATGVVVTLDNATYLADGGTAAGQLKGIQGTLTRAATVYTFTRLAAGTSTGLTANVERFYPISVGQTPGANVLVDPYFQAFVPTGTYPRKRIDLSQLSIVNPDSANPFGTPTLRFSGLAGQFTSKYYWLDEMGGIRTGDTIVINVIIKGASAAGAVRIDLFQYDGANTQLSYTSGGSTSVTLSGVEQLASRTMTLVAGCVYFKVAFVQLTAGTFPFDVYALWGSKDAATAVPPSIPQEVLAQLNTPRITTLEGINVPRTNYTQTEVAVSPGTGTIQAALTAITDNTALKRYRLMLAPGTYLETGQVNTGLLMKDYVDIFGAGFGLGTGASIIQHVSTGTGSSIGNPAACTVSNLTLYAFTGNKYCAHTDGTGPIGGGLFTLRNVTMYHENLTKDCVGGGFRLGQDVLLEDVTCNTAVAVHSAAVGRDAKDASCTWTLRNVQAKQLNLNDFYEYRLQRVVLSGCAFDLVRSLGSSAVYDANTTDPLFNRGYKISSLLLVDGGGNSLGRFDNITYANNFPSVTRRVFNSGASTIVAGKFVKHLADNATVSISPPQLVNNQVDAGIGIPFGVVFADILAGTEGTVQFTGTPLALVNAATAVAYGDELEVAADGTLQKRTTGRLVANAMAALATGTSLIQVQLV